MAIPFRIMKNNHVLLLLVAILGITAKVQSFKAPFRTEDILPLLPRRVSLPILYYMKNAADLMPSFVGGATGAANSSALKWKGSCFYDSSAWLELHNKGGSKLGGGTLHIKVNNAHSLTCMDLFVLATPYRVTWNFYVMSKEHTIEFREWETEAELEYVKTRGVSIFLMQAGMIGTLKALWEVFPLFTNSDWGEKANIEFLKKHMGATFEVRPQPSWVTNISVEEIHSGDFLALSKIRGRWGAFETLEKWVTGAYAGHSAVCLKDSQGKLWVAESGRENEKGEDIIAIVPWNEWWEFELKKDASNPHIALLPLHPEVRAKFNETAAWEYAKSMSGLPYGYHNLIFSWIDTKSGNYPSPLDAHLVASALTVWNQMQPAYAGKLWSEALNKRLGTQNYSLSQIVTEVEKRGSSFADLLVVPEKDDWVYVDGKSASCVAYVLEIYKAAGIFGNITNSVQSTEFTIKDATTLKIYENNSSRLPTWCNAGDTVKLPFCQIKGKYRMELPGYNTMDPYPNMNEKCPSLPPKYERPANC